MFLKYLNWTNFVRIHYELNNFNLLTIFIKIEKSEVFNIFNFIKIKNKKLPHTLGMFNIYIPKRAHAQLI